TRSPSKRSIARLWLPSRPALNSLSGSGSLAPWSKVTFTLPLWGLATAMIPSRDHTGLPIHFHSSTISASASRMALRTVANVLLRQSVSPAINWSMRSEGVMRCRASLFQSARDSPLADDDEAVIPRPQAEGSFLLPRRSLAALGMTEHHAFATCAAGINRS